MPLRQGAVERDGVKLHYLDWGGSGPPLVLIHATGFLAHIWRPIAERLASRFRVVAFDQRGHGDSDAPDDGYTFDTYAADLQRLIETLELERPIAAGHSSGATTIVVHAARYPRIISRAVLIEPILPRPEWYTDPPGGRKPSSMAEGARKRRAVWPTRPEIFESYRSRTPFDTWREDVLRIYVDEGTRVRDDGQVELKCSPEARFFDSVTQMDFWPLLPEMQCPALFVWGEESNLHRRKLGKLAKKAVPTAKRAVVPGATHFVPQEQPDEVSRLIDEFLSD